ncbi:uncharacterized protein LOC143850673 [Tasmannia lanceolata]|uniref:uncharacterized protein LOC143850673 n=1 Tax=Tasmannia lanceolata TaxID=3420 RepID=UPI00406339B8
MDLVWATLDPAGIGGVLRDEHSTTWWAYSGPLEVTDSNEAEYVATLRELLENLRADITPDGLPSISKAKVNDYSVKIEVLAAKLAAPPFCYKTDQVILLTSFLQALPMCQPSVPASLEAVEGAQVEEVLSRTENVGSHISPGLRKRRYGKLQENLTDEMVGLAQQLKESSILMNQSLEGTEKILDCTETAVEHSLVSTGYANTRAMEIYSETFKTTCFTWLIIFFMTCIFLMVVLLIRVT